MPDQGVITQNLREFTVKILKLPEEEIVGTGLAVSLDGRVATCAHVVEAAGVDPKAGNGGEVGVYFPQTRVNGERLRRAEVAAFFPEHDDDLVLLKLKDGPGPLAPEQMPVLGRALDSKKGNTFWSYGYRRLEDYQAGWASGEIMGHVEAPPGRKLQEEPVQLRSPEIDRGMSGSGVLDEERNLVIGLVSETWFPDKTGKDPYTAWAVDALVLSLKPLALTLQDQAMPKREAPTPTMQPQAAAAAVTQPGIVLYNAPDPVAEWVGREDLLRGLDRDWLAPERKVTGLIGFGGEGKSSLARRWLDELLENRELPQPQGVFWWGFYEKRSVEEFLAAALTFFSGGRLDPRDYASTFAQAHLVAGMLATGRYLLVLDGLEVLQHQEGDRYGELTSQDLREFLQILAAPGHQSYTLITSRAPLMDLLNYTTYGELEVDRLSPAEGLRLLRELRVKGAAEKLAEVVEQWDGHALTLSLVGGFLKEKYRGDVQRAAELHLRISGETRYARVQRVLDHYDGILTEPEREFLTIFSAFRLPVPVGALGPVFRGGEPGEPGMNQALARLGEQEFPGLLGHLRACRLLRFNETSQEYVTHPLIRGHYQGRLAALAAEEPQAVQTLHRRIKDYYLEQAGEPPEFPTLEDLSPYIEAVHHACRAREYDAADDIRREKIYQREKFVLTRQLGAYEMVLGLYTDFFPEGDLSQDPQVGDRRDQGFILNGMGLSFMSLGRLPEAAGFYQRSVAITQEIKDWKGSSATYRNLSDLHLCLGELPLARQAAAEAVRLAQKAKDLREQLSSLVYEGWAAHHQGDGPSAAAAFTEAEALERRIETGIKFLYSLRGLHHADHLRRTGDQDKARQVTMANLEICERNRWPGFISHGHRLLGELAAEAGKDGQAREHFRRALELARSISHRAVLLEALAARGRWLARRGEAAAARRDLEEGLGYATAGGYRILEVDLRVGLAWANLQEGNLLTARQEANLAKSMSREMGYHWGKVDSQEVLAAL